MRFLVLGCGSMGKRRIRDLLRLQAGEVYAFDVREDRRREVAGRFGAGVPESLDEAMGLRADALFVCVPPDRHARYIEQGMAAGMHVFSEAPTALSLADLDRIIGAARALDRIVAPSCTYLHYPLNQRVAELVASRTLGKLVGLLLHCGDYIGNWHPYEDYRTFYASDREQGGMCVDVLIHLLHLAQSLTGEIGSVTCLAAKRGSFESHSGFDTYDLLLESRSGASVNLHYDLLQKPYSLIQKAVCENGTIGWDWNKVEVSSAGGRDPAVVGLPEGYVFEDVYLTEVRHFLDAVAGRTRYRHPLEAERAGLKIILAAEESSRSGVRMACFGK